MIRNSVSVFMLIGLIILTGCAKKEPVVSTRTLMGTVVTITVFDEDKPEEKIQSAINYAFAEIERIEISMWGEGEDSEVHWINSQAGERSASLSDETFLVIMEALKYFDKTKEVFDIRVGPLVDLWGFATDHPAVPDEEALAQAKSLSTEGGIFVAGQSVMLGKKGMKLDLSGLAKGYAVEKATEAIADQGIQSAIIEAGGDLRVVGTRDKKGSKWHIGIRHPRNPDQFWGVIDILYGSVATSGDYENFFEQDGKRYHHILDPKTGYPADKCVSVTVWGEQTMQCDALATALFVLGPEVGMEVVQESFPKMQVMFIYQEGEELKSVMTPGFEEIFRPEAGS